jgi:hypothetical protein
MSKKKYLGEWDEFFRLKPHLVSRINDSPNAWPDRNRFLKYAREEKNCKGSFEQFYSKMKAGLGVPKAMVECFVLFLREVRQWGDVSFEQDAESAVPAPEMQDDGEWTSVKTMFGTLTNQFNDCEEMYFHNPRKDSVIAARMFLHTMGYLMSVDGELRDQESCMQRGQKIMDRTVEEYAEWLYQIVKRQPRSIMYIVKKKKGSRSSEYVRIGASTILPLTEDAFNRVCSGQLYDRDITPDDLQQPTDYIFVNLMAEPDPSQNLSVNEATAAQIHCMLYQAAYFTRSTSMRDMKIIAVGGIPKYVERLKSHGYEVTEYCMNKTPYPIMILKRPEKRNNRTFATWVRFNLLTLCLRMFQVANYRRWRRKDKPKD